MSGILGGGSSKTDRGNQLAATSADWNIFNRGLGLSDQLNQSGQELQQTGKSNLSDASQYWKNLLTAGRTETAANAAPAVNAAEAGADATRAQRAQFGTGRSGATVAQDAEAGATTQKNIDDIINQNLIGGREAGARGLASTGATELSAGTSSLSQALQSLGLSEGAANSILENSFASRKYSDQQHAEMGQAAGKAAAQIALAFLAG